MKFQGNQLFLNVNVINAVFLVHYSLVFLREQNMGHKCDVFLNFRDEDTRDNFTKHLYDALCEYKISTFKDDEKLEKGMLFQEKLQKQLRKQNSL